MKTRLGIEPWTCLLLFLFTLFSLSTSAENLTKDGTKTLTMVHAFWRHGDRSPQATFFNDPIKEGNWKGGGGGWGEVTTEGMEQLMNLGARLRKRYVESGFLSPHYNSRELYIYASPFNRTIVSALACMVGMYSQGTQPTNQIPRSSKEKKVKWPENYVPIPIHSYTLETDHIALPDGPCPRQTKLLQMVHETPEWIAFTKENETIAMLEFLNAHAGQNITYYDLGRMYDTFFIEKFHNMTMWNLWTPELMERMRKVNNIVHDFYDALDVAPYKGVDLYTELAKIRIGTNLNEMIDRMVLKEKCNGRTDAHCAWYTALKFHGVSGDSNWWNSDYIRIVNFINLLYRLSLASHDSTMSSYFSAIGAKRRLLPEGGWPLYVSCILTETWKDEQDGQLYIKLVYTAADGKPFNTVTNTIRGCESFGDYCPLGVLQGISEQIRPDVPILQHCLNDTIIPTKEASSVSTIFSFLMLLIVISL